MFTCTITPSGGLVVVENAFPRASADPRTAASSLFASFTESTDSTATSPGTPFTSAFALLDCTWPMNRHRTSAGITAAFSTISCT